MVGVEIVVGVVTSKDQTLHVARHVFLRVGTTIRPRINGDGEFSGMTNSDMASWNMGEATQAS